MKETWKKINGFENYRVSNFGRVKSLFYNHQNFPKILKDRISLKGYHSVHLSNGKKIYQKKIHRLVAEAFINNEKNKPEVNHKDGNKGNNIVSNLEWCTSKENQNHALKNKIYNVAVGERQGNSKLKNKDVISIRKEYKNGGISYFQLSEKYGICFQSIGSIVNYKTWKHI